MGKKGSWLSALSFGRLKSNDKKNKKLQISQKSKGLFRKHKTEEFDSSDEARIEPPSPKPIEEFVGSEIEDVEVGHALVDGENTDEAKPPRTGNDNETARNEHIDENGHVNSVLEEENEVAWSVHLDEKDAKDENENSVVEEEKEDVCSSHLATKDVVEAEVEDATNANSTDKGREDGDEYSMVVVENEDATDFQSVDKNTKDGDEYSVAKVDNEDVVDKDIMDGAEYSVVEVDNEDAMNAQANNDKWDADEFSMVDRDNEDEKSSHSVDKDIGVEDEYSVIEAKMENEANTRSPNKDTEDGDEYSVIEAENENATNAHSIDKDTEVVEQNFSVETENKDGGNSNFEENDHDTHSDSIISPSVSVEEVVIVAEAASVDVQLSTAAHSLAKSKEEIAALKIQSAFRGYMARRSFWALKGLMRLKTLIRGQPVKRQASTTLRCMQAMARVQKQVGAKRIRMAEENQALHRQLQHKHYLDKMSTRQKGHWDDSPRTKEQIQEQQRKQQLGIIRRERELAYAYSHEQPWKNSPKQATQNSLDPHHPQWGWNWLEKWMATRPWENQTPEELNSEPPSAKTVTALAQQIRRDLKLDQVKASPSPKKQTQIPPSHQTTTPKSASTGIGRVPKSSGRSVHNVPDDAKSIQRQQSNNFNKDVESPKSLPRTPSSMSRKILTKAKSRLSMEKNRTPEKASSGSAKKKVSLAKSPSHQRSHSDPSKTSE